MTEFKVGDKVRRNGNNGSNDGFHPGDISEVIEVTDSGGVYVRLENGKRAFNTSSNIDLVRKGVKVKESLVRFMTYGMGCNNKGKIVESEKELKQKMIEAINDSNYSGRIIGYKLVPILEIEKVTKFKVFKAIKVKKIKKRKR